MSGRMTRDTEPAVVDMEDMEHYKETAYCSSLVYAGYFAITDRISCLFFRQNISCGYPIEAPQ